MTTPTLLWAVYTSNYYSEYFVGVSFSTDGTFLVVHFTGSQFMVLNANNAVVVLSIQHNAAGSYT